MCLLSELLCLADTFEREPFSAMDSSRITGNPEVTELLPACRQTGSYRLGSACNVCTVALCRALLNGKGRHRSLLRLRANLVIAVEREKPPFPNQNSTRREPWITRGPPPTTPAVVPTAVAVALPRVAVILPKFPLLWLAIGFAKLVWLKRLKKSARKRRWTLSVCSAKSLDVAKFQLCKPGP